MYICLFVFLLLSSPFPQATAWGNSQEIMKHLCNLSFQAQVPFSKLWGSQWQMLGVSWQVLRGVYSIQEAEVISCILGRKCWDVDGRKPGSKAVNGLGWSLGETWVFTWALYQSSFTEVFLVMTMPSWNKGILISFYLNQTTFLSFPGPQAFLEISTMSSAQHSDNWYFWLDLDFKGK